MLIKEQLFRNATVIHKLDFTQFKRVVRFDLTLLIRSTR